MSTGNQHQLFGTSSRCSFLFLPVSVCRQKGKKSKLGKNEACSVVVCAFLLGLFCVFDSPILAAHRLALVCTVFRVSRRSFPFPLPPCNPVAQEWTLACPTSEIKTKLHGQQASRILPPFSNPSYSWPPPSSRPGLLPAKCRHADNGQLPSKMLK